MDEDIKIVYEITQIMQEITNIVKYYYGITFDEESVYYYRFITHLKYFAQRLIENKSYENNEDNLLEIVKFKYKNAYNCIEKINEFMNKKYNYNLTDEEKLYLTIHVEKVVNKGIQ